MKSIAIILITLSLISLSFEIHQTSIQIDRLPFISKIYFQAETLLYLSTDQKEFGTIDRSQGTIKQVWELQADQTITTQNNEQLIIFSDSDNGFVSFLLNSKQIINIEIDVNTTKEVIGYLKMSSGEYFLTEDQLYAKRVGGIEETIIDFGNQLTEYQIFQEIFQFNYRAIVLSDTQQQFCFLEIDLLHLIRKFCLPGNIYESMKGQSGPGLKISGDYIYLFTERDTVVLDKDFSVVGQFDHEPLQFHQGFVSISGYQTYSPNRNNLENYKVVSHQSSTSPELIKMKTVQERDQVVVIERLEQKIGEIAMSEEPVGAWIDKSLAGVDFTWGVYYLVFQFASSQIKMYSITVDTMGKSQVALEWTLG